VVYLTFLHLLTGCQTPEISPPSPTPAEAVNPTPSVVWFPPTQTPTLFPTIEIPPTPELRPGIGEVLYADDFSTGEGWPLLTSLRGNVALGKGTLALTVLEPRASVMSIREGLILSDFYLEITAKTSLCSGEDQYGVMFRVASQADFYRFALSCNGQTRLDRLYGGIASSPQPWMFTSAVPSAPFSTVRLGIWAVGNEMRFFINDHHQFTVSDSLHPSGGIGVFARSAGDTALTVNFLDLRVWGVNP
jgi:hypothetical protein